MLILNSLCSIIPSPSSWPVSSKFEDIRDCICVNEETVMKTVIIYWAYAMATAIYSQQLLVHSTCESRIGALVFQVKKVRVTNCVLFLSCYPASPSQVQVWIHCLLNADQLALFSIRREAKQHPMQHSWPLFTLCSFLFEQLKQISQLFWGSVS